LFLHFIYENLGKIKQMVYLVKNLYFLYIFYKAAILIYTFIFLNYQYYRKILFSHNFSYLIIYPLYIFSSIIANFYINTLYIFRILLLLYILFGIVCLYFLMFRPFNPFIVLMFLIIYISFNSPIF